MLTMYILLTLTIAVVLSFLAYWCSWVYTDRKKLRWMPGELGLPFFGIIFEFLDNTKIVDVFGKYNKKHKGLYWINTLTWSTIITTDYKFVEFLLTSNEVLDKGRIYQYLEDWLGLGLLTAPGSQWRSMRKILTPAFHFSILEQFVSIFESNVDTLVSLLKEKPKNEIVDIFPLITMYTLDNICESAMGINMNAQGNPLSEYVIAVKKMCSFVVQRAKTFTGRFNSTYQLSRNYYKQKKVSRVIQRYTDDVINSRKKEFEREADPTEKTTYDDLGRKRKLAFLDLLLKARVDGQPLSHKTIRDEVNTFMFAGHDTTASSISSIIYCLANHPDIQRKAAEEQRSIFGDEINRPATYRDLQEMRYLENIIKETLRLYPPVPFISRVSYKDIQYEEGKIIPAGVEVFIFIHGINRNPDVFLNPDKFDPERFNEISNTTAFSNIPFSAGPRNCIGQKFAMLEMKLTMSKLLRNLEFYPPGPGYEPIFTSELVFHSINGINVVLKERHL